MATLEERMQATEQEHTALKKTVELQAIAIGALASRTALEKLNEKYDKMFETLINHDRFTNEQLAELRGQNLELDGKIVGLQTETRQRFTQLDGKIVGLQTETRQRFTQMEAKQDELDGKIVGLQTETRQRFTQMEAKQDEFQTETRQRFAQIEAKQNEHTAALAEQKNLLTEILARLPGK